MKKVKFKGGALIAPLPPVMVTCGTEQSPNVLTVGWTGIINTIPPKTYVSIRPSRFSYEIIKQSGEFVINLTTTDLVRAADFCGVKSGRDCNKFELMNLSTQKASEILAPLLEQSPVSLECRVTEIVPLGSHDMFLADIVAVNVAEDLIDEAGKFHFDKCNLVAYSHGEYFELGKKLGTFGFSVRKKAKKKKRK